MSRLSLSRLLAIARKEVIQLRRDPRSLAMAFLMPALLILLFGYAISFDVRDIRLAVLDLDRSARSRELVDAFTGSGYFRVAARVERDGEAEPLLERGAVRMVWSCAGLRCDRRAGRPAVQALVDGGDGTAAIALNYARAIVSLRRASCGDAHAPVSAEAAWCGS
jgi:ABC-2 type transport system permease protein